MRPLYVVLNDDGMHVLPQGRVFRELGRAKREQARRPGSRLVETATRDLAS
jgi:hypothetical protein